jgi:lipoyl(octanoyl) transferase
MDSELWVCDAGTIPYGSALALQERLREARQAQRIPDVMLLLEHPPVYTRGRRSEPGELTMGVDWYRAQGIEIFDTRRGGKVTYHGPGQLVGYPIVGVDDVVAYVRLLEQALIAALSEAGIEARARVDEGPAFTGVWVEDRKIASIGVHLSRGVTAHGFALNVDNDMRPFDWVVACGLPDVRMTSVAAEQALLAPASATSPTAESGESATSPTAESGEASGRSGQPMGAAGEPLSQSSPPIGGFREPVGPGGSSGLMPCIRKRVAFAVANALGRRQRLVSLGRLQRATTPATPADVGAASAAG